ncbi:MAG: PLP-dependent aminotransferase family protein [Rhizomicrobium sp.]|jgi:GntR family transcriptional regulator/MocR family aminotransferase
MNLPLQLDRGASIPLQDQLFEQLRQLILTGKLKPNSRIIATRFLAEQVGVSRTTVLLAYERLISEGYLETRPAVGTFVCSAPPKQPKLESAHNPLSDIPRQASLHPAVFRGSLTPRPNLPDGIIDFSPSRFDASHLLPAKVWLQGIRNVFEREPDGLAKPQPAAGVLSLRRVIVDYLAATRGIMASPEQVIIVVGQRQACSLVAHLFQRRGDRVVVESPGDESVVSFFKARDADVIHVPVDEHGLETDRLPQGPASLVYVTPARQNPLGGTLPQSRRGTLLGWAREAGAYLIEDDSDSEFRYHGTTPQPLAALDPYGLVFYTGCFAKTLGAGLGLGYLVVPSEFVDAIVAMKSMAEEGCPWLEQMVVADLLTSGEYDHHLRRVRKIYLERRNCLIQALRTHFGDVRLIGVEIGTQLTWLLPEHFPSARAVCDVARAHGVNIERVISEPAGTCRYHDKALVFGYGALMAEQLGQGIARLADVLNV